MESNLHQLIVESGYFGNVITSKLSKDVDNRLYTLIHLIGGLTTRDVFRFAEEATEDEIRQLSVLVTNFPSKQHEILPYAGGYRYLVTSSEYKEIVKLIKKPKFLREGVDIGADGFYSTDTHPYFTEYISPKTKKALFKQWDKAGEADFGVLKLFGIEHEDEAFDNVSDVVFPVLAIEWMGGIKNTPFAQMGYSRTNEGGWSYLKFRLEPIGYDFMFDESANFGDSGYSCWDIRVLIDKESDVSGPSSNFPPIKDEDIPFIQKLFPESARGKLSHHRNYTNEQQDLIEMLWEHYADSLELFNSFCSVEVVLVDDSEL